jgi:predicted dienelactone hydrolase
LDVHVRLPVASTGPLPVVIWSPDSTTLRPARETLVAWSEATARAGYMTVTISHPVRDQTQHVRLCRALEIEPRPCFLLDPVNWDWPKDQGEVISWMERANQSGPDGVRGRIDLRRIAVAGYAAGGNGAVSLAGAKRLLTTENRRNADDLSDPRVAAVVSLSPQGPLNEGFFDADAFKPATSWLTVGRPVLMATGSGDNNCTPRAQCRSGDTPMRRRVAYELMPAGGKYLLFINSVRISHEFLETLDTQACEQAGAEAALCSNFRDWLRSAVHAFLDAHLRNLAEAQTWMRSGLIRAASAEIAGWETK